MSRTALVVILAAAALGASPTRCMPDSLLGFDPVPDPEPVEVRADYAARLSAEELNELLRHANGQRIVLVTVVTGVPGPNGAAGIPGASGAPGESGDVGPTGAAGRPGARGAAGAAGMAGATGPTGPRGADGAPGATGPAGAAGVAGPTGPAGAIGPAGPIGPAGSGIGDGLIWRGAWSSNTAYAVDEVVEHGGSAYVCRLDHVDQVPPDASYWDVLVAKGDAGAAGAAGAQGPAGVAGADGAQGPQGDPGAAGAQGPQGDPGADGAAGPQGAAGPAGPQGAQGAQGVSGRNGGGIVFCATPQTTQTWTNMPLAQTEMYGTAWGRRAADLTGYADFRVMVVQPVGGAAAATFRAQYSVNGGAGWSDLENGGTTADLAVGAGTGLKVGAWAALAVGAIGDVQVRIVGFGGDGSADPSFRYIAIELR